MTAYEFGQWEAREGEPFNPGSHFVLESEMTEYALGFLNVQTDNQAALRFISNDEPYAELRAIDLEVDAAQSRPDDWTAAQRDAAPVADRPQLREDDGDILYAF